MDKKTQIIQQKKNLRHRFSNRELNNKNAVCRRMISCGVPVEEFLETFPGNSFFDYIDRDRKLQKFREIIHGM